MDPMGMAALVTGGGSGRGEAVARNLVCKGSKVDILDPEAARADAVSRDIDGFACACDVTESASVESAITTLHDAARSPIQSNYGAEHDHDRHS
jgi:NAD(P)-dependent dehydrogenase (short-subunit alcohol dehydrogenase family)